MLSLTFNIDDLRVRGIRERKQGTEQFIRELAPALDLLGMTLDAEDLRFVSRAAYRRGEKESKRTQVEGALITLDAGSGHILAMVGGSKFETGNQFNRATQARLQPGSAFKPLYYSAAISSRGFTPASMIVDAPVVFVNDDGTQYVPLNYKGEWQGPVLLRTALARSMNVPSLKVLDEIGFDAAIERASRMLGIAAADEIESTFPRKYPLGLGVIAVSPLQMAQAYASFANEGRAVTPLAIQYIMDRNGRMVLEVEKELRARQRAEQRERQIMSPQVAYIMTHLLQSTVQWGHTPLRDRPGRRLRNRDRRQDRDHAELVGRLDRGLHAGAGHGPVDGFRRARRDAGADPDWRHGDRSRVDRVHEVDRAGTTALLRTPADRADRGHRQRPIRAAPVRLRPGKRSFRRSSLPAPTPRNGTACWRTRPSGERR